MLVCRASLFIRDGDVVVVCEPSGAHHVAVAAFVAQLPKLPLLMLAVTQRPQVDDDDALRAWLRELVALTSVGWRDDLSDASDMRTYLTHRLHPTLDLRARAAIAERDAS